jgi:hypothetical protein
VCCAVIEVVRFACKGKAPRELPARLARAVSVLDAICNTSFIAIAVQPLVTALIHSTKKCQVEIWLRVTMRELHHLTVVIVTSFIQHSPFPQRQAIPGESRTIY